MNCLGSPTGSAGTNWKGGRYLNTDGYVVIWTAPRTRRLEHRVVMEKALGRKLSPAEHVHHKNGDRADNLPDNLELLTRSEHRKIHNRKELAKVTASQVIVIRRMYEKQGYTQKQLGRIFCISQSQVSRIVLRQRWADI